MIEISDNIMKFALSLYLSLLAFSTLYDKTFSLTNYQINKICKKEKRVSICIKKFQEKRDKLKNGELIEIPVIPYKGN